MPFRQSRRIRGGDPALLRQLRGQPPLAAVDQPPSPAERVFAALTLATMLLISAFLVSM